MGRFRRFNATCTVRRIALVLSIIAGCSVLFTLDGPGITVDEPLDVRPGRGYVSLLRATGARFFTQEIITRTYLFNKEHPPLGRWLLGIASTLFEPIEVLIRGSDPLAEGVYIRSARVAPAMCFAVLVGLVTCAAGRSGRASALAAGVSLAVMPRVFGHAHIAALDTFVALFWTLALLAAERATRSKHPVRDMAWAGVTWGLALLVKIHAWLLPPVVLVWTFTRLPPRRAMSAGIAWAAVGLTVFFAGWPWLWFDPVGRLRDYLFTAVHRQPLLVQYFGAIYQDVNVPWHYPWVYFAVTVPVGVHVLAAVGLFASLRRASSEPSAWLWFGSILLWLTLFSTRIPMYDCERLFLPVFPLWAILAGLGFGVIWQAWGRHRPARWVLGLALALQSFGVVHMSPFWLGYYNGLVAGLSGANRLGLELTYWGDTVDSILLDRLARMASPGDSAVLVPTLVPDQGLYSTTRGMAKRQLVLRDQQLLDDASWVVVFRRSSYWPDSIRSLVKEPPAFVRSRDGIWLSGVWKRSPRSR